MNAWIKCDAGDVPAINFFAGHKWWDATMSGGGYAHIVSDVDNVRQDASVDNFDTFETDVIQRQESRKRMPGIAAMISRWGQGTDAGEDRVAVIFEV